MGWGGDNRKDPIFLFLDKFIRSNFACELPETIILLLLCFLFFIKCRVSTCNFYKMLIKIGNGSLKFLVSKNY